jgi:hypothetical protein
MGFLRRETVYVTQMREILGRLGGERRVLFLSRLEVCRMGSRVGMVG